MPKKIEHMIINEVEHKWCSSCSLWQYLENFDNSKQTWDKKHGRCKTCQKNYQILHQDTRLAKQRQYYYINKEALSEKMSIYYHNNKDKFQSYYEEHKEEIKKRTVEYNRKHMRNYNKEYSKEYYWANLQKSREQHIMSFQKRRTLLKNGISDMNVTKWFQIILKWNCCCAYCGKQMDYTQITRDHVIPISKEGNDIYNNCVPACSSCNSSKKDKDIYEWYLSQEFYDSKSMYDILMHCDIE